LALCENWLNGSVTSCHPGATVTSAADPAHAETPVLVGSQAP
jgi:hypothetical protein